MIAVLLSTYNGEKFLREQLNSIVNQTHEDFKLYIRDDGSIDQTLSLLSEFDKSFEKIEVISDKLGNIGVAKSYFSLMLSVEADFYLFADQDDIWELNKLEELLKQAEAAEIKNEPYVVFSNMSVFGEELNRSHDFFKRFKINAAKVHNGLFQGTISGCLMLFNHEARKVSLKLNKESNMLHDWDILIVCYLFGKIDLNTKTLVNHRIHEKNVVGENLNKSRSILIKDLFKYIFKSESYRKIKLAYYFKYIQLCLSDVEENIRLEKEFFAEAEINDLSYIRRKRWYLRHFNPFIYGRLNGFLILLTI